MRLDYYSLYVVSVLLIVEHFYMSPWLGIKDDLSQRYALHFIVLYYITLHYILFQSILLYYIISHRIVSYRSVA